MAILSDLRNRNFRTAAGRCHLVERRGIGIIAPLKRKLKIDSQVLTAPRFFVSERWGDQEAMVVYGAKSKILLDICKSPNAATAPAPQLSEAETARLALMAAGLSDKLIARRLGLAPATVRTYNSSLFRKLGVADRDAAVRAARDLGILPVN